MDHSISAIAHRLATQDNACTAHPIFVVQQRERIYGNSDRADNKVWLSDEGDELSTPTTLEEEELEDSGAVCIGYVDRWEFVQPFFTRGAAEAYIEANRHRMTDPRVWVGSAYRNKEWQAIDQHIRDMPEAIRGLQALDKAYNDALDAKERLGREAVTAWQQVRNMALSKGADKIFSVEALKRHVEHKLARIADLLP